SLSNAVSTIRISSTAMNATSNGRPPKVMIAALPMTLPAFRPTRRRSHFRKRMVSSRGTAKGMMTMTSGQTSPRCRVFGRPDLRRTRKGTATRASVGSSSVRGVLMPSTSLPRELRLVNLVQHDLVRDAPPRQPGDLGRAADVPPRLSQGPAQETLLEGGHRLGHLLGQRPGQIDRERHLRLPRVNDFGRQVLRPNPLVPRGHAGPLDGVLQLADVPRPTVAKQHLHRLGSNLLRAC